MVYLTSDVKKYADQLGINEKDSQKLYKTSRHINKFLKEHEKEQKLQMPLDGGAEYEEQYEEDEEMEQE